MRLRPPATKRTCERVVSLLTDYMEGAVSPLQRHQVVRHLRACAECSRVLAELEMTVRALNAMPRPPETTEQLVARFRASVAKDAEHWQPPPSTS